VSAQRKRETVTVDVPGLRDLIDDASHAHPAPWIRALIEDALRAPKRPSTRVSTRRSRTDGAKVTLFLLAHEHEALVLRLQQRYAPDAAVYAQRRWAMSQWIAD
jgi:hypothetical protein